jgi:hypothetical protein
MIVLAIVVRKAVTREKTFSQAATVPERESMVAPVALLMQGVHLISLRSPV